MKRIAFTFLVLCTALLCCSSGCRKEASFEGRGDYGQKDDQPQNPSEGGDNLSGKTFLVCANSMVYYGGLVQKGSPRNTDAGMFYQLMKAYGHEVKVIDCTYGSHHLYDFISSTGCKTEGGGCSGLGSDLLEGVDLSKVDYMIISEAGNNYDHFYSDAVALFKRVEDKNPKVKKFYINHIYSVYKKHDNVLGKLKTLHDADGVTIVNCGQLAYDIYSGALKVPGGSLSYSDRYTFTNHTSSDTYHPNPLMGYIMTQMAVCAVTGADASYKDFSKLVMSCSYATGSVSYSNYYNTYYTTPAALPFMKVLENEAEMKGIQQLIPSYINKY